MPAIKDKRLAISVCLWIILVAPTGCDTKVNNNPDEKDYSSLKIVPPPEGGMYLGQTQFFPGDIATFEAAIGRSVALWTSEPVQTFEAFERAGRVTFDPQAAERAWQNGKIVLVRAYEAYGNPNDQWVANVDSLLRGGYEADLVKLAAEFRAFGKPMFFHVGRELNGLGSDYFGGFGPNGDQPLKWALENQKGLAEFDPSGYPNAHLYADLGDPEVSDGVERLIAAQRYYYDFFVQREGLQFLTFDTMGWAAFEVDHYSQEELLALAQAEYGAVIPPTPEARAHAEKLLRSSFDFATFYPGDDYVDWVSLNFYIRDAARDEALQGLDDTMAKVRRATLLS